MSRKAIVVVGSINLDLVARAPRIPAAGETITVDFSPARDGSRTGLTTRVTLADGTVLSQASPQ